MDGGGYFDATEIDPTILLDFYNEIFEPDQFSNMFATEIGKGVLVGCYVYWTLMRVQKEEEEAEDSRV